LFIIVLRKFDLME